jgi:hypothetical protein
MSGHRNQTLLGEVQRCVDTYGARVENPVDEISATHLEPA